MKPLLKYPGGKERELKYVIERLPDKINSYYEPFFGGGAVFFGLDTDNIPSFINDKSEDLVLFYNNVACQHALFFQILNEYVHNWEYLSEVADNNEYTQVESCINPTYSPYVCKALNDKLKRMRKIEAEKGELPEQDVKDNIECGIKQGYYYYIRDIYNSKIQDNKYDEERAAAFFFLREFCYSSMFRFNSSGEFNVPYGGITYNRKDFRAKVNHLKDSTVIDKFGNTTIEALDFYDFMKKYPPTSKSFIFLDPPYDSDFSDYDNNVFNASDQRRLADYLITECKGQWLMIIKASPLILSLYEPGRKTANRKQINIEGFDKKYSVSFKNRNPRDCEHLIITNYRG